MQRIKLTNWLDVERGRLGQISPAEIRSVELDALVDTGATTLILPADVADQLGLTVMDEARARLADGSFARPCASAVFNSRSSAGTC